MKHEFDFKLDNDHQSIEELWSSLSTIVSGRVADNRLTADSGGDYPLTIREKQLMTIETMVTVMKETHAAMRELENQ